MSNLAELRREKDAFFAQDPASPLAPGQRESFQGLKYYPENPVLRMELAVQEFPAKETIQMAASKESSRAFQRFGKIKFKVEDQDVELTVYHNENGYFLPFVDGSAGRETYPAGRYLEPEALGDGKFLVDFNLAYNPYCAYDERWSCPLTPFENHLRVPIRAGEKLFHAGED